VGIDVTSVKCHCSFVVMVTKLMSTTPPQRVTVNIEQNRKLHEDKISISRKIL